MMADVPLRGGYLRLLIQIALICSSLGVYALQVDSLALQVLNPLSRPRVGHRYLLQC